MKYIQRFVQHMRVVASTWSRVLILIWKTNPWYVTWLLVFTFLAGLIPSVQIQITSQIIQNAAQAIQEGHAPQLVHLAILFGLLQGGLMLVSSVLGIGQQQLQSLLQTKLANVIAIQIMEKAIELDVQYFEDDEFYDKLQRANRENVGFGYVEELDNDERIRLATAQSGAAPFIEGLPQKYETTLGRMFEKGHELSIGQWQKMALARAFMRRAPVVVLDEPTSSIDAESEAEIFGRLQQIAAGATTLLIAHRFSTVRVADRIIVIKQGKIIEDGMHEVLIAAGGTYAHLFRLQAAGYVNS